MPRRAQPMPSLAPEFVPFQAEASSSPPPPRTPSRQYVRQRWQAVASQLDVDSHSALEGLQAGVVDVSDFH